MVVLGIVRVGLSAGSRKVNNVKVFLPRAQLICGKHLGYLYFLKKFIKAIGMITIELLQAAVRPDVEMARCPAKKETKTSPPGK